MYRRLALAVVLGSAALLALTGAGASARLTDFSTVIDNTYLPLTPGTSFHYEGTKDHKKALSTFEVTSQTREIVGVTCVVVNDTLTLNGKLAEQTNDYFAQDRQGNVWYFGEDSFDYVHGKWVRSSGSWLAGVDGAQQGIVMEAHPRVGDVYQQEFYPGHAEDMAEVLSLDASVTVPYGSWNNALQTKEWTPLEPGVVDNKYYAPGVGEVRSLAVEGGSEEMQLVSITHT
jgi:hypothetical protein